MKIMFCCGEVSSDLVASELIKELYKLDSSLEIFGIGGEKCKNAGMNVLADITHYNTVGLIEAIPYLKIYKNVLTYVQKLLYQKKPDLLLLIDNEGFNLKIAKFAKKLNIPVIYYFAPQVWLFLSFRKKFIANLITHILAVYKKEFEVYQKTKTKVTYVGHPIIDICNPKLSRQDFLEKFNLDANKPIIGLFPGSRNQEIKNLLLLFIKSALKIKKEIPETQFLLSVASKNYEEEIKKMVGNTDIKVITGYSQDIIKNSNFIITCSGSITIEATYLNIPMIIVYKTSILTYFIAYLITNYKFIAMPNILANKEIVPELLQNKANVSNIKNLAIKMLEDKKYTNNIKEELKKIANSIGEKGNLKKTAKIILNEGV